MQFTALLIISLFFVFTPDFALAQPAVHATQEFSSRQEQIEQYKKEFVSSELLGYANIAFALDAVLLNLPENVFAFATDRTKPVLFINTVTSGIARFARSMDFTVEADDPPTFTDGFRIILLGDELNQTADPKAIEGVIYHELAHHYLGHLQSDARSCELEREANAEVKRWGFEDKYLKAKEAFGAKKSADSPCFEE